MSKMPKNKIQKKKKVVKSESLSGDSTLSLNGFRATQMPDCSPIKFVYSDYRVLTAAVNQADYVYRCNSLFDPDFSGVGGQPDGFDTWKTIYGVYRVVAVEVEVQAVGNGAAANGLLAVGPSETSGSYSSAEEVAGLRHAGGASYSPTAIGHVRKLWRIGQLLGRSDETILADPNCSAAIGSNPVTQYYVHVAIETGNAAAGQTMVWTKLTFYTRMEVPTQTIDAAAIHRNMISGGIIPRGYVRCPDGSLQRTIIPRTLTAGDAPTNAPSDDVISAAAQFEVARSRLAAAVGASASGPSMVPGL
jgi:hypothetical protein